ncbi:unnamed protein product [Caenorhabditis bovis]|uniref:Nuclear receptor domain-containing protein n=1 Tax=Caenorhabditis bovis TaxID=2654633 RepID=A0A8S1F7U5_9PELO|nr:unnamed protein product [Caenorhabditis bovis]
MESDSKKFCAVCLKESHGYHFGAETCRACAAFFRRSVYLKLEFKCGNYKVCKMESGRWKCKKCRLRRCYEVGMQENKIQYDRDLHSTTTTTVVKIPKTMEQFAGRPHILLLFDPELASPNKTIIDVSPMLEKVFEILKKVALEIPVCRNLQNKNLLQRIVHTFEKLHSSTNANNYKLITNMNKKAILDYMEQDMIMAAQFVMDSHIIDGVSVDDKLKLASNFWQLYSEIGKLFLTLHLRGERVQKEKIFFLNGNEAIDLNKTEFDISWMTKYSADQINK